jgi:hypothetical protein
MSAQESSRSGKWRKKRVGTIVVSLLIVLVAGSMGWSFVERVQEAMERSR